jgi:hypothetical protein
MSVVDFTATAYSLGPATTTLMSAAFGASFSVVSIAFNLVASAPVYAPEVCSVAYVSIAVWAVFAEAFASASFALSL